MSAPVTPLVYGSGEIGRLGAAFPFPAGRGFLVSSPTVLRHHGEAARRALSGRIGREIAIDDREAAKTFATLERIVDEAVEAGVRRDDFVVALGGGVVTDVAGFAAAILLRGIAWYAVPTTLLGMADAAIGGKTAIDHRGGKNLVGAFHPAHGVLVDPALLTTLSDREYRSGLSEVYKAALIADRASASRLAGCLEEVASSRAAEEFLPMAIRVKQEIVSRDPREDGPRRLLNFGHTLGHAVEAFGRYERFTHGEAVAIGMAAAIALSADRAGFPAREARRLSCELVAFAGRDRLAAVDPESTVLWGALARDKKASVGATPGVLLHDLGCPVVVDVSAAEWKAALLGLRLAADL